MRRTITRAAALAATAVLLTACGSGGHARSAASPHHWLHTTIVRLGPSSSSTHPSPTHVTPSIGVPPPEPVPAVARDFTWAERDDSPLGEAYTLTLVRGLTPRQALSVLVPPGQITTARGAIARADRLNDAHGADPDPAQYYQTVLAGEREGWTYVLEDNNFLAVHDGASSRLSRRGAAVAMYENIELDTDFQYARNGRLVREFETFSHASLHGRTLPQEHGLPFGTDTGRTWMRALELTLAGRLTGLHVRPEDLATSRFTLGAAISS